MRACLRNDDAHAALEYLRMLPPAGTFASMLLKEAAASGRLAVMRAIFEARALPHVRFSLLGDMVIRAMQGCAESSWQLYSREAGVRVKAQCS